MFFNTFLFGLKGYCETLNSDSLKLHEECPNTELFLVRIWTLFTQCKLKSLHCKTRTKCPFVLLHNLNICQVEPFYLSGSS